MGDDIISQTHLAILFLMSLGGFVLATEIGFRLGLRVKSRTNEASRSEVSTLQGALLGLLGLMLGFTFALATSRFDTRKELVLAEANAIGTTWLRAQLLPGSAHQDASTLLRQYLDLRLKIFQAHADQAKLAELDDQSEEIHRQLWSVAAAAGRQEPRAIPVSLFIQSLNELIDLHDKRLAGQEDQVPDVVLKLLYFVALIVTGLIGYGCGLGGRRNFFVTLMASILIAAVILVIIDLDRPGQGLIQVRQQRLIDLQHDLTGN